MSQAESFSAAPIPSIASPIRLWPGVVIVAAMAAVLIGPAVIDPGSMTHIWGTMFGPLVGFTLFMIWWLFFSRVSWASRLLGLLAFGLGIVVVSVLRDPSFNVMGGLIVAMPSVLAVWVLYLLATPFLAWPTRLAGLMIAIVAGWSAFALFRYEGTNGVFVPQMVWRYSEDDEARFARSQRAQATIAAAVESKGDWTGFRGPHRDSVLHDANVFLEWSAEPPKRLWKQFVGKGWGSFAVVGKNAYTQEQRGDKEAVVCLDVDTGAERWSHLDDARFDEMVAGPGPRATPTFHDGKLYTQGAKGVLNCFDAADGKLLWSRDIYKDSGATEMPNWGYAASPLVVDGVVITVASKKAVLGYDAATGEIRWQTPEPAHTYASPHLAKLRGVEQVLLTTEQGVASFDPKTGARLWTHEWPLMTDMARCTQPQILSDSDLLIGAGFGFGLRRVQVDKTADGWTTKELWTSKAIKPYFNDGVVHKGHLYGFDGAFFVCVDAETGKSKWRARGYGNGQALLSETAEGGVLLILSESGEVAAVRAIPERHEEIGRFAAIEGKTWNHPVVAHNRLFVRNGGEAACFELAAK